MKIIISNAFSLSMLDRAEQTDQVWHRYPKPCENPVEFLTQASQHSVEIRSVVGHVDTAALFSKLLDREIAMNRESVKLVKGDILLVGQYIGPRLPEGATELPTDATIEWWTI